MGSVISGRKLLQYLELATLKTFNIGGLHIHLVELEYVHTKCVLFAYA